MDKQPDFGQDLATLSENVNAGVGDVLDALREKRSIRPKVVPIKDERMKADEVEAAADNPSPASHNMVVSPERRPRARTSTQRPAKNAIDVGISKVNFTTRLRPETKAMLEEAKLRQMLKKETPDDYEDIVHEALWDWYRKNGYALTRSAPD